MPRPTRTRLRNLFLLSRCDRVHVLNAEPAKPAEKKETQIIPQNCDLSQARRTRKTRKVTARDSPRSGARNEKGLANTNTTCRWWFAFARPFLFRSRPAAPAAVARVASAGFAGSAFNPILPAYVMSAFRRTNDRRRARLS